MYNCVLERVQCGILVFDFPLFYAFQSLIDTPCFLLTVKSHLLDKLVFLLCIAFTVSPRYPLMADLEQCELIKLSPVE